MTGNAKTPRGEGGVKERGINELISETWALIDQAKKRLSDSSLSENDKIRWAGVLASAIGTLNRLLWKVGAGKMDEEDLASILSKVPGKYAKIVKLKLKGVSKPDFEGIGRGDLVEVTWLDASLSRGIVKVTNRTIATYKRTVGRFVGVFKDRQYGHPHVLIQHEVDENGVSDVSSVPLGIVVGVKKLAEKEALKKWRNGASVSWTSPLEGGGLKIVTRKVRK